jgi:hypothetical protein
LMPSGLSGLGASSVASTSTALASAARRRGGLRRRSGAELRCPFWPVSVPDSVQRSIASLKVHF